MLLNLKNGLRPKAFLVAGIRSAFAPPGAELDAFSTVQLLGLVGSALLRNFALPHNMIQELRLSSSTAWRHPNFVAATRDILGLPTEVGGYAIQEGGMGGIRAALHACDFTERYQESCVFVGAADAAQDLPMEYSSEARSFLAQVREAKSFQKWLRLVRDFRAVDWLPLASGPWRLAAKRRRRLLDELAQWGNVSKDAQDEWAYLSHMRARSYAESAAYRSEIAPLFVPPEYKLIVNSDVHLLENVDREDFSDEKSSSDPRYGTTTSKNIAKFCDGAAAFIFAGTKIVKEAELKATLAICDYEITAGSRTDPGESCSLALRTLLKRHDLKSSQISCFEFHEESALQTLLFLRAEPSLSRAQVNPNGGALAYGLPLASSGLRSFLTIGYELQRREETFGCICASSLSGASVAILVSRAEPFLS